MREIKFRAWDIQDKKMISVVDIHFKGMTCEKENDAWDWYKRERILMQFTGLHDKNGKEVFEGDILDFDVREWGESGFMSVVKWDEKNACWLFSGGTPSDVRQWRAVIGNIYENPLKEG